MVRGMYKYRSGKCFAKILLVKHFTTSPHKFYGQNKMFSCLTKVLQQQKTLQNVENVFLRKILQQNKQRLYPLTFQSFKSWNFSPSQPKCWIELKHIWCETSHPSSWMERVEVMMQGPMSNIISVRLCRDVSTFAFFFFCWSYCTVYGPINT